jgi:hypothetical protein
VPYHVLTHSGKAHMDELLAIALLAVHMNEEPKTLLQKESREVATMVAENAIASDTFVIDAGLMFEADRNLFDHHQDGALDCAALLIFNHFFGHLKGTKFHAYLLLVSKVDTQGVKSLDDAAIISESKTYWSFSQQVLLRQFEKEPYSVLGILIADLKDRIAFEQKVVESTRWLEEPGNVEVISLGGVNILKYNRQPPRHLISPMRAADAAIIDTNNITAIYSFDDKDPKNRILFRTDRGAERVDFKKANPKTSLFTHQGGFLLKFIPADDVEWMTLIRRSLVTSAG